MERKKKQYKETDIIKNYGYEFIVCFSNEIQSRPDLERYDFILRLIVHLV
jgi:hypothetical protein